MTRLGLLRWALFQYLIGNADAHGKNMSFFCNPAGLALTGRNSRTGEALRGTNSRIRPSAGNVDGRNGAGYGES
jgi:hypothetical protein